MDSSITSESHQQNRQHVGRSCDCMDEHALIDDDSTPSIASQQFVNSGCVAPNTTTTTTHPSNNHDGERLFCSTSFGQLVSFSPILVAAAIFFSSDSMIVHTITHCVAMLAIAMMKLFCARRRTAGLARQRKAEQNAQNVADQAASFCPPASASAAAAATAAYYSPSPNEMDQYLELPAVGTTTWATYTTARHPVVEALLQSLEMEKEDLAVGKPGTWTMRDFEQVLGFAEVARESLNWLE